MVTKKWSFRFIFLACGFLCMGSFQTSFARSSDNSTIVPVPKPFFAVVPSNTGFVPEVLSGDGKVVLGLSFPSNGLWKWTAPHGLSKLSSAPMRQQLFAAAANYDGSTVVGRVLSSSLYFSNLFLWNNKMGLVISNLTESHHPISPIIGVKSDGSRASFICSPDAKCSKIVQKKQGSTMLFVTRSGDVVSPEAHTDELEGVFSTGVFASFLAKRASKRGDNSGYLSIDSKGQKVILKESSTGIDVMDSRVVSNTDMSLIAIQNSAGSVRIWDSKGNVVDIDLPGNCQQFSVSTIDNTGAIFGSAYCLYNAKMQILGFRFFSGKLMLVATWLAELGVRPTLPQNTVIFSASDDGKTLLGVTNEQLPVLAGGDSVQSKTQGKSKIAASSTLGTDSDFFYARIK